MGTECRYHFFRDLQAATQLTSNHEIEFRRSVVNQWLNTYVPIWRRLLHFNMDARVLWSGNSLQAIRYVMQYAARRQSLLDYASVVELALQRRIRGETTVAADKTEVQKGVGRLMALAFSSSGAMEIGRPLATAILFDGGAATFSCTFERLVLFEGLNILERREVESSVVSRKKELHIDTTIRKYTARPSCLENCNWYDFCVWNKVDVTKPGTEQGACRFSSDNSVQLAVHVKPPDLTRVDYPRVPEIIGPRVPDACRQDDADLQEQAELYYLAGTLLYCPFLDPKSFLDHDKSAEAHFRRWELGMQPKVRRSLEFHQHLYLSLDEAYDYCA